MAGSDTVRGIGYQQAQAVVEAIALLDDPDAAAIRVEGVHDVVDLETLAADGSTRSGKQFKIRADEYTWGKAELISVLRQWAALPAAEVAPLEFVTDGRLGPTGDEVQAALLSARQGELAALAELLNEPPDGAVVQRLTRARIRRDAATVGALLGRAELQVAAMLPDPRAADLMPESQAAVDRLFRLLFQRAGEPDAETRVVRREEIADVLGVPADQAPDQRWPGTLRVRYVDVATRLRLESTTAPLLNPLEDDQPTLRRVGDVEAETAGVLALLECGPASILFGRTGTGKTTACSVLVRDAAARDRVVLRAHAEGYLPGRLAALVADAMSEVLGDPMPTSTGRQVLADPEVLLVIDGVSEVPSAIRESLAAELGAPAASGRGVAVLLVGRDVAVLRATLPTSVTPAAFTVADLDPSRRVDLASRLIGGESLAAASAAASARARMITAQVDAALGDAAGNPLLFTMAAMLVGGGVSFTSRSTLYEAFIEGLAKRTGATDLVVAARVLGVLYAELLDDERRYADAYRWERLVERAVDAVNLTGLQFASVDTTARRAGLIVPVGYAQIVMPMHDSFADYLAGAAHAEGLVDLPQMLRGADEQRILFATEIAGVDSDLALRVARDLPFLLIRIATHDRRDPNETTPDDVAALLRFLLPHDAETGVALWRHDGRVVAFRQAVVAGWVDDAVGHRLLGEARSLESVGGPVDLAVRLWRQEVRSRLSTPGALAPPRPKSIDDACTTLAAHVTASAAAVSRLIDDIVPAAAVSAVVAEIGPLGMTARIQEQQDHRRGAEWPVSYAQAEIVDVQPTTPGEAEWGQTTRTSRSAVEFLVSSSPYADAAKRVTVALNRIVGERWL